MRIDSLSKRNSTFQHFTGKLNSFSFNLKALTDCKIFKNIKSNIQRLKFIAADWNTAARTCNTLSYCGAQWQLQE